jgi:hypothetical protein
LSFSNNTEFLDVFFTLDNFNTSLRNNITASGTEIPVLSVDGLPDKGWLTIGGKEVLFYNGIVSGTYPIVSGCERSNGEDWAVDTLVEQRYNSEIINNLIESLK